MREAKTEVIQDHECTPSSDVFPSGQVCSEAIGPVTLDCDCAGENVILNTVERKSSFIQAGKAQTCTVTGNGKTLPPFKGRGAKAVYSASTPSLVSLSGWWFIFMFSAGGDLPKDKGVGNIPDGPSASFHTGEIKGKFDLNTYFIDLSEGSETGRTVDICAMLAG